ncbi:MAG: glycosyltransferase family 4 protein [Bernardetiaceae bacterium]
MEKKNIWYISKYATPIKYFFGTRHFYYGEVWAKEGHRVCVITSNANHLAKGKLPTFRGKSFREVIQGVETIWLNTFQAQTASGLARILSWLHFEWQLLTLDTRHLPKPDVVIVSSLSLLTILNGYRLKKKYNARLIFEIRDIWPLTAMELGGYSAGHPFIRVLAWVERFGYRKADAIVGTMPNLAEHVRQVCPQAAPVYCMPQGIQMSFYTEGQRELDQAFIETYIPKGKFVVGYAGALGRSNSLHTIVEAARLLQDHPQIHVVLLGDGDFKTELEALSEGLPNISFAPRIEKPYVQSFLRHCQLLYDSVADTVIYRYGLSRNKWMDYMYAAKPIVASYSGFLSLINEAQCGEAVPAEDPKALADKLLAYAQKPPQELEAMGQRAHDFLIENRTFETLAKKYVALFGD